MPTYRIREGWIWQATIFFIVAIPLFSIVTSRPLNFDEMLSVRVGWLIFSEWPNHFYFAMPYYAVLGGVAYAGQDPGMVFVICRLLSALLVVIAIFLFVRQVFTSFFGRILFVFIVFCNLGFVIHGLELRYDAAIFFAFMLISALFVRCDGDRPILVGLGLGLLSVHHLKGVLFAACLFLLVFAYRLAKRKSGHLRWLLSVSFSALALIASWLIFAWMFGFAEEVVGFYIQFFKVSKDLVFQDKWSDFLTRLQADYLWYICILPLLLWRFVQQKAVTETDGKLLLLLAVPLLFVFFHPHPWPYMVIYIVPFLAALAVMAVEGLLSRSEGLSLNVRRLTRITPFVLFSSLAAGGYLRLLEVNWDSQIAQLRFAIHVIRPEDKVVDPSGFLYFARPADPEWYTDSLVRQQVGVGGWQASMHSKAATADYVVESYRLSWLPPSVLPVLQNRFHRLCGAIYASKDKSPLPAAACPDKRFRLQNFWN